MDSNQKAFDDVVRHLFAQRKPATNDEYDTCDYRGPNDLKCAIGALIKDEYYSPKFEGESVSSQKVYDAVANSGYLNADHRLLCDLQRTHDMEPPNKWHILLKRVANDHDLNTHVLDQMEPII